MPPESLTDLAPALRVLARGETQDIALLNGDGTARDHVLERYAVVPSLSNPRVLLPLDATMAALGAALAQHAAGASSPVARAAARGLRLASQVGMVRPLLRHRIAVATVGTARRETPLHAFLADVLGRTDFVTSIRIAPRRPNGKPVVQAIAEDGGVLAYAKFGWEPLTRRLIRHEAGVLNELAPLTRGTPLRVPRVLFGGDWHGLEALVLAPLRGHKLKVRTPADIPVKAALALAALRRSSSARLGESLFWHRMAAQIGDIAPALDELGAEIVLAARDLVDIRWGDVDLPMGQCHGDWIPPNMSEAEPDVFNVWDWELSASEVPLGIDAMQFILYLESRRRQSPQRLAGHLHRFGREALARQALDPATAPLLLILHLLRMIVLYGQARRAGQAKDGDRRYLGTLNAVLT